MKRPTGCDARCDAKGCKLRCGAGAHGPGYPHNCRVTDHDDPEFDRFWAKRILGIRKPTLLDEAQAALLKHEEKHRCGITIKQSTKCAIHTELCAKWYKLQKAKWARDAKANEKAIQKEIKRIRQVYKDEKAQTRLKR